MPNAIRNYFADLPRATLLLFLSQAIHLTCLVVSVTVAAIVGLRLAPNNALATLPYGVQALAVLLATYPASALMKRHGRRAIFSASACVLIVSGGMGYLAVQVADFMLLTLSHALLGVYAGCAAFYRFAAVDDVATHLKPRVISLVVSGGLVAALIGPTVSNLFKDLPGSAEFAGVYGSFMVFGVLTLVLMALWHPKKDTAPATPTATGTHLSGLVFPLIVAIFCGASAYFIMNLIMIQSSLTMNQFYSFAMNSHAIQMHVMGMFLPTLFAGHIIGKFGIRRVCAFGFALLIVSALISQISVGYYYIYFSIICLGVGWCFAYVGGSALLTAHVSDSTRHRWQGVNEFCIASGAAMGAFLPAPLLELIGWQWSNMLGVPICVLALLMLLRVPAKATAGAA